MKFKGKGDSKLQSRPCKLQNYLGNLWDMYDDLWELLKIWPAWFQLVSPFPSISTSFIIFPLACMCFLPCFSPISCMEKMSWIWLSNAFSNKHDQYKWWISGWLHWRALLGDDGRRAPSHNYWWVPWHSYCRI